MSKESIQHKLKRVRPPRVKISYDVETNGAVQQKELPMVVGVMADLSGKPEEALPRLKERKFVNVDRDNFNGVLAGSKPRLAFSVPNRLTADNSKLGVEITFGHIDDFEPASVARKVPALARLLERRQRLSDLVTKLDGNDNLNELLADVVQDTEQLQSLKKGEEEDTTP